MSEVGTRRSLRPNMLVTWLAVVAVALAGWFAIGPTPAAQRVADEVRPYDPLP